MEQHELENPGHVVHFSIHDSAYWCSDCPFSQILPWDEREVDAEIMKAIEALPEAKERCTATRADWTQK